jgi:hypothetical protein
MSTHAPDAGRSQLGGQAWRMVTCEFFGAGYFKRRAVSTSSLCFASSGGTTFLLTQVSDSFGCLASWRVSSRFTCERLPKSRKEPSQATFRDCRLPMADCGMAASRVLAGGHEGLVSFS